MVQIACRSDYKKINYRSEMFVDSIEYRVCLLMFCVIVSVGRVRK